MKKTSSCFIIHHSFWFWILSTAQKATFALFEHSFVAFSTPPCLSICQPQAMFRVLEKIPDIPKTLSAEGRDFLSRCFRRNPALRPSANQLLEHPFVLNSHDQTISHYAHNFSLMNLVSFHIQHSVDFMKSKIQRKLKHEIFDYMASRLIS